MCYSVKPEQPTEETYWFIPEENILGRLLTDTMLVMHSLASYIDKYMSDADAITASAPHFWGYGIREKQVPKAIKKAVLLNYGIDETQFDTMFP